MTAKVDTKKVKLCSMSLKRQTHFQQSITWILRICAVCNWKKRLRWKINFYVMCICANQQETFDSMCNIGFILIIEQERGPQSTNYICDFLQQNQVQMPNFRNGVFGTSLIHTEFPSMLCIVGSQNSVSHCKPAI